MKNRSIDSNHDNSNPGPVKFRLLLAGAAAFCFLAMAVIPAGAQGIPGGIPFDVSLSVDWVRGELNSQVSYNLAQAGVRLPTGRFLAEEILQQTFAGLLRPHLLSLRLDSSSILRDMTESGELFF